ncbi:hypothetical protein DPEC_G00174890 [Dallia pectoralis]|uniref:Uncharacterized protein n=1 Tax=Dallia pectoralis TaxID=75939 RepID=A0ACC2GEK7_DALPE|nr:hypothetical protein DPEC_G00174890 [Dallia pectoralis]
MPREKDTAPLLKEEACPRCSIKSKGSLPSRAILKSSPLHTALQWRKTTAGTWKHLRFDARSPHLDAGTPRTSVYDRPHGLWSEGTRYLNLSERPESSLPVNGGSSVLSPANRNSNRLGNIKDHPHSPPQPLLDLTHTKARAS